MALPYAKRYAGGFFDLPIQTTPIDDDFLNAVETALIALCAVGPSADQVPIWNNGNSRFEPGQIANAQVAAAAAIAYSKLNLALSITNADIAAAAAIGIAKLAGYPADATKFLCGDGTWAAPAAAGVDGWTSIAATLTYSSTDGPTFVCGTSSNLSGAIPVGARIKLTHSAATKYFIVTAIDATTITLYGGTDYTLAGTAITSPSYSLAKGPVGFPTSPLKWTEQFKDTTDRSQASAVGNTWYNPGTQKLSIPIGIWRVEYFASAGVNTANQVHVQTTLSTANNSELDADFSCEALDPAAAAFDLPVHRAKYLALAAKTDYFLNIRTSDGGTPTIVLINTRAPSIIRAICALL